MDSLPEVLYRKAEIAVRVQAKRVGCDPLVQYMPDVALEAQIQHVIRPPGDIPFGMPQVRSQLHILRADEEGAWQVCRRAIGFRGNAIKGTADVALHAPV